MECLFCNRKIRGKEALEEHCRKHTLERSHLCPKCPKELVTRKGFQIHLESHKEIKEREMECHLCGKVFISKIDFKFHVNYHDGKQFECKTCGKKYGHPDSLRKHEYVHKNWKAYFCNICQKAYSSKRTLKGHEDCVHKQIGHECHICGRKFGGKGNLKQHIQRHNPQRKRLQCDKCPKSFLDKAKFQDHQLIHQNQEYSFQCDKCEQRFITLSQQKAHKRNFHLETSRIFSCVFCEKQFPQYSALKIHLTGHTLERPRFCKLCPAEFCNASKLRHHFEKDHLKIRKQFKCNMCPKSLTTNRSLENHIRQHMGELNYECQSPGCGMRFVSDDRRKRHFLKTHVGKQFSCSICKKAFLTKIELNVHVVIHTNFSGYKCGRCHSSFNHRSNLKRHERTVHASDKVY